jgi:hypothetical protein
MKRTLNFGLLLVCSIMMMISCRHKEVVQPASPANPTGNNNNNPNNPVNPNPNPNNPTNPADTGICFERDILPIFISNCAKGGCHDAATRSDGYRLTDYNSIVNSDDFEPGNAEDTKIYEAITDDDNDDRMPKAPNPRLLATQISLIRRWINEGAKNGTNCSSPCDSTNYKYSTAIKPMTDKYCVGCHNTASLQGGYAFDSYAGLKKVVDNGRLPGAVKHLAGYSPMPKGGAKLSACEIKQFEKWLADGAPNN